MARPKTNSQDIPARQRIKDAYWDLMQQQPFEQITVKQVLSAAHVSRTTFYYHFESLRAVLDDIEADIIPTWIPAWYMAVIGGDEPNIEFIRATLEEHQEDVRRACFLLGPNGDAQFIDQWRQAAVAKWTETLGLASLELSHELSVISQFIVGGVTSLMASSSGAADPFGRYSNDICTLAPLVLSAFGGTLREEMNRLIESAS